MQSVLKAPLFKKLFIFLRLRQHFERLWGQSGELLGPGRRKRRRRLSPQIRKWWISFFFKVCAEREVARQGVWPQCPVSPLLSPLLIFSSFFSLNLSQVFFPSLYLLSFLFSSLLLSIISVLFPSFILPSYLLSLSPSLFLCISFSNFLFSFFYLAVFPDSFLLRSSLLFTL